MSSELRASSQWKPLVITIARFTCQSMWRRFTLLSFLDAPELFKAHFSAKCQRLQTNGPDQKETGCWNVGH